MKTYQTDKYLDFLKTTQRLKNTLRHAWTEDVNRQESTADHSWHMAMMAIAFTPELINKVNLEKVFQLIAVHDLGEAITGDIPAWAHNHSGKADAEDRAVSSIANQLPNKQGVVITRLYHEYKDRETIEAKFVKMLDVIDALNQHLVSDFSTWVEVEYACTINQANEKYFINEPFILGIFNGIQNKLRKKLDKRPPK